MTASELCHLIARRYHGVDEATQLDLRYGGVHTTARRILKAHEKSELDLPILLIATERQFNKTLRGLLADVNYCGRYSAMHCCGVACKAAVPIAAPTPESAPRRVRLR